MGYVATNDAAFNAQLINFNSKLGVYDTQFGLTNGVNSYVANSAADSAYFNYILTNCVQNESRYHDWVSYKTLARKDSVNTVLGAPPAILPSIVNPGAVASGIEDRFRTLCQRIKAHGIYTANIGLDLGIEVSQSEQDMVAAKPALSIKIVARHPHIDWKKGGFTALDLNGTDDATGNYVY